MKKNRTTEKVGYRSRIGEKTAQNHAENQVYLEPIRNRMHRPIEGRSRKLPAATCSMRGVQKWFLMVFIVFSGFAGIFELRIAS